MRALPAIMALAVFTLPALAQDALDGGILAVEDDTYRFGDLYRSERGTTVDACAQMCTSDTNCASWSLVPATFQMGPRCELKQTPGEAVSRPGAVSGMSEYWQMDPVRHTPMRYQPSVPESRQPAAVPLDQLRPSPVPRVFGDPLPAQQPELLGAPGPSVVMAPASVSPVKPVPVTSGEIRRGPGVGTVPDYVKQPAPEAPKPPTKGAVKVTPKPVFKDPALKAAAPSPGAGNFNAVVKRQGQVAAPIEVARPAAEPLPQRVPWTERDGNTPNYSVGGTRFVPGDEEATAGFVEGLPEAGS